MRQRLLVIAALSSSLAACSEDKPDRAKTAMVDGGRLDAADADAPDGFFGAQLIASELTRISNPTPAPSSLQAVVDGNTAFALGLYQKIRSPSANVVFSPFSVSLAMAMVWAGSQGTAAQEIASVFHFGGTRAETHTAFNYLDQRLETSFNGFVLHIANSLWLLPNSSPKAPFLDVLATNYGAGVHVVDLTNGSVAAPAINGWVSQETAGLIDSVVSPTDFDGFTRLALANAIYFNGRWSAPFDATLTADATFTRADGTTATAPTMKQTLVTGYSSGTDFQAAEIQYEGATNSASMVLILPAAAQFETFAQSLDGPKLASILSGMQPYLLDLSLPRFNIDPGTINLGASLSALGMADVFSGVGSDFSPMAEDYPTKIQAVLQRSLASVDEQGTKAAGATVVILGRDGGILPDSGTPTYPSAVLHADRPFLFLIRDTVTGTVLFLGHVTAS